MSDLPKFNPIIRVYATYDEGFPRWISTFTMDEWEDPALEITRTPPLMWGAVPETLAQALLSEARANQALIEAHKHCSDLSAKLARTRLALLALAVTFVIVNAICAIAGR